MNRIFSFAGFLSKPVFFIILFVFLSVVSLFFIFSAQAGGGSDIYLKKGSTVAVEGHDVVAYFTENRPVKGSSSFVSKWKGAEWHFSSAENKALFDKNPEKYAPRYGGYCAYAVALNSLARGAPEHWSIVGGKLYLNFSSGIKKRWEGDVPNFVKRGDSNWPGVLAK